MGYNINHDMDIIHSRGEINMSHKCCNNDYGNNLGFGGISPIIIIIILAVLFCGNRGNFGNGCGNNW